VKKSLIVTSIAKPNAAMQALSAGALQNGYDFICVGDKSSPDNFYLKGCRFISLDMQLDLPLTYAAVAPLCHYARKNIGYLLAIKEGAEVILETDDDNSPANGFWDTTFCKYELEKQINGKGWFNIYNYFGSDAWPRGFPLENIVSNNEIFEVVDHITNKPLIRQGLVAGDADVDAIYRLTRGTEFRFEQRPSVVLGQGVWSPFNSQNTLWERQSFGLLYLPATCSFRATDIIRSYVATRCLWEIDAAVLFTAPTAIQRRNVHNLLKDFSDEVLIYLKANEIAEALSALSLMPGEKNILENLKRCYIKLESLDVIKEREFELLNAWCEDLRVFY
jgi:hypothetical protein